MEPTPADVAAVSAAIGGEQPTQQPAPQPTQPQEQPAPQPVQATDPVDPFAALFAQPTEQPVQQPTAPTTQATEAYVPQAPVQTTIESVPQNPQQPQQPAQPQYDDFDAYMERVMQGIPKPAENPDANKVDATSEEDIKGFFDELVNTAVQRAEVNLARKNAIQTSERQLWDDAFKSYGTLKDNKPLRDTVHAIRMSHFQKGMAITPSQAAKILLDSLGDQYRRGIADNQVATTIEQVQPNGGGAASVPTTMGADEAMRAVQVGGEQALTSILDAQIRAGKL